VDGPRTQPSACCTAMSSIIRMNSPDLDRTRPMTRVVIGVPSRLHFGLLGWGPMARRQFGGVGLMIEKPGIDLVAEPASEWRFDGALADRVRDLVGQIIDRRRDDQADALAWSPARIQIITAPPEHVGLGVGTQLSLAVVRALLDIAGNHIPSLESLARLSGRGRRSGIGLHGFLHGGLIVDGGRRDDAHPPPLVARVRFPEEWSVLTVQPPGPPGRHGTDEIQAFSGLPALPQQITERLCRLVLLGILPAIVEKDLASFGASLSELQEHVGAAFAPVQGGTYATPQSEAIIAKLGRLGMVGAGQSSWGPTLYAFGSVSEFERTTISSGLVKEFGLDPSALGWTRAANHGAVIRRLDG
jgi:beta-ribofuranosylaminobenzene 5'-phosphate synthase